MRVNVTVDQIKRAMGLAQYERPEVFAESLALMQKGYLPVEMLQAMSLKPQLLLGFGHLGRGVYPGGDVPRRIKEWIILFVSRRNNCQFCFESHCQIIEDLKFANKGTARTMQMSDLMPDEEAAVKYAMAVTENVPPEIMDPIFAKLKTIFTDEAIVEITFMAGLINCLNLFNNALGVRYNNDYQNAPAVVSS